MRKTKMSKQGRYAKSDRQIEQRTGISRTIWSRLRRLPGCPYGARGWHVERGLAFAARHATTERVLVKADLEFRELKKREQVLRNERREFDLQRDRGAFLEKAKVARDVAVATAETRAMIYAKMKELPVKLQGCDAILIGEVLLRTADEIVAAFRSRATPWTQSSDPLPLAAACPPTTR